MGLLEIILTITAYRKGWKAIALIPMGVGLLAGFTAGIAIRAGGGSPQAAGPAFFLGDVICVAVLAWLTARGPKTTSISNGENPAVVDQPKAA